MNIKLLNHGLSLLPMAVLTLTSCSTDPKVETTTTGIIQPGVPGGVAVETFTETATVTSVDKATRKVTLVGKDGKKTSFKAGPQVANFNQIEVGDQVKATMTEQLVVFVRQPGEPSGDGAAAMVVLAPLGAKPGALMANTEEVTAKVTAIDLKHHKATLLFADGDTKTFKVRQDVDLTKQSVGAEVVIRTTETLAISVEKP